jgi:hypothetical protein
MCTTKVLGIYLSRYAAKLIVTKLTLDADRDVPLTTVIRVAALRTMVMHCYNAVFPQT